MTAVGRIYGEALYDLAAEEQLSGTILEEISALAEILGEEPDFLRLLDTPNLGKDQRLKLLDDCLKGKLHPYVLNFLKLLSQRGHIHCVTDCCKVYRQRYDEDNGILPVRAVTAVKLSQKQQKKLTEKLETLTGRTVRLTNRVEPEVLGGVRLEYGGKYLDGTVSHRLDAVRKMLKTDGKAGLSWN